jgi:hypothetical protein
VVDQLCAELGCAGAQAPTARTALGEDGVDPLGVEDEALVAAARRGLERVATAAGWARQAPGTGDPVGAALDGAEMVVRGELVCGNPARVMALMPNFVFLVTLPLVDQDEALELSRRTAELVERALSR